MPLSLFSLPLSLCPRVQVRDAQAGKTAETPSRASLEGQFAPGRWLFRVTADAGAALRATPKVPGPAFHFHCIQTYGVRCDQLLLVSSTDACLRVTG